MGGSLGFLLGLSVIGFIIVLEKILGFLFLDKLVEEYKRKVEKEASAAATVGEIKEAKVLETD